MRNEDDDDTRYLYTRRDSSSCKPGSRCDVKRAAADDSRRACGRHAPGAQHLHEPARGFHRLHARPCAVAHCRIGTAAWTVSMVLHDGWQGVVIWGASRLRHGVSIGHRRPLLLLPRVTRRGFWSLQGGQPHSRPGAGMGLLGVFRLLRRRLCCMPLSTVTPYYLNAVYDPLCLHY